MSGRFSLASFPRRGSRSASRKLSTSLTAGLLLASSATSALAQTVADLPEVPLAPAEPSAPPAPDPPAPAPSEPGPPSQAPPSTEPAPAPTPTPEPAPAEAPQASPGSSAAFAPVPGAAAAKPQPKSLPPAAAPVAAATTAPKPAPAPVAPAPAQDDDNSGGLLGPFRIGVLVGTGLPEVVNLGAQLKLTRFFGAGVNVGLIPTVKIQYYGEAAQKYQEYDAYGHIYPFGGSFFLGAGVGYAQIDGVLVNRFNLASIQPGLSGNIDVTSDATVRTLVLTPQIGFLKIFDVGFAVGIDIGAQIPIAPSEVRFNTTTAGIPPQLEDQIRTTYISPNDAKVRDTLNTLGRTPLPTFNFKIGWFL